ncbi:MAG: electron transport complex protein RnfC [Sulfobacillus benefaciens]|uniref:Electron transport complex protein RnfC n=1 Tax=Sulfobacillus benefaciens TaxID=453960 RepID=A0A2T2XL46_9FIRM|nr:MAG: electron transport complex protein RnfC [Sulfobacillus benefaciens]
MGEVRRLLPEVDHRSQAVSWDRVVERGFDKAYQRVLDMGPEAAIAEVTASGIMGRGGAAFPTGRKWDSVRSSPGTTKYAVMNADESELGTFKDRVLLEQDPMGPLIGLLIAAHCVGARQAYCYIRGEYREVELALIQSIAILRSKGWIGKDAVEVEVRRGAGAYIAGEETALFNSIEGKRPEPRVKPPFPTVRGLFGAPTLIQNVETLANVAVLFSHDVAWFRQYGTPATPGTKLVAVSGHVTRPGVFEVPFGTPLQEIINADDLAGGMAGTGHLQAVLLGGAAGTFLSSAEVDDVSLDYGPLAKHGASIGSGAVMVFDDSVDLVWVVTKLAHFFADESCGQCVPCRIGTRRILEILRDGDTWQRESDLRDLGLAMRDASICGLGQTAPVALLSMLDRPYLRRVEMKGDEHIGE